MIKLPISDYVANYYKEHNIQLTYRQQARLCWTEAKTYNERISLLEQILKESDDEELNREIEERITYEKKAFSIFATNDINQFKPPFEYDDNNRFENLFLNIECPFGVGDIVMSEEWENPQVVAVDHDCFKQRYERLKNNPDIGSDASDNFICTEYRDKDGNLDYEHTNPFQLWKIGNINEE